MNKEKTAPDKINIMTTKIMKARDAGVGSTGLPVSLFRNNNARKLPKRNTGSRPKIEKRIKPPIPPIIVPMVLAEDKNLIWFVCMLLNLCYLQEILVHREHRHSPSVFLDLDHLPS